MVIRPVEAKDLDALEELAHSAGGGLTTLPTDRTLLKRRIEVSYESFAGASQRKGEAGLLFVLEDTSRGRAVGTCGIQTGVGLTDAFYSYRVSTVVHASRELGVYTRIPTLYLCNDYTGSTEIGSLLLAPNYRGRNHGKLLSKSRFLFLAEYPEFCPLKLIGELRGVSDEAGRSPFWESLGKHFFAMEFSRADYLSGTGNKTFIAELMPKQPLYVPLLSVQAQGVIGKVHDETRPALRLLQEEGFRYEGYVDIFDAGPTYEATLPEIRAVRESRRKSVQMSANAEEGDWHLISNTSLENFRCSLAKLSVGPSNDVSVSKVLCQKLQVQAGDPVRVVRLI